MINRMEAMTGVDIDGDGDVNDDPPEFTETHKFHVVGGPRAAPPPPPRLPLPCAPLHSVRELPR